LAANCGPVAKKTKSCLDFHSKAPERLRYSTTTGVPTETIE